LDYTTEDLGPRVVELTPFLGELTPKKALRHGELVKLSFCNGLWFVNPLIFRLARDPFARVVLLSDSVLPAGLTRSTCSAQRYRAPAQHVVNGLEVNWCVIDIKTYFGAYEHMTRGGFKRQGLRLHSPRLRCYCAFA
jgi:hypothetical protein